MHDSGFTQGLILYPLDSIRFMRVDALSLLLCLGNVTANADVLVVDMLSGILTGAIAERLGGMYLFLTVVTLRKSRDICEIVTIALYT